MRSAGGALGAASAAGAPSGRLRPKPSSGLPNRFRLAARRSPFGLESRRFEAKDADDPVGPAVRRVVGAVGDRNLGEVEGADAL